MATWSSLRLLAGIWCDVVIRWPVMVAADWLKSMKGSA